MFTKQLYYNVCANHILLLTQSEVSIKYQTEIIIGAAHYICKIQFIRAKI